MYYYRYYHRLSVQWVLLRLIFWCRYILNMYISENIDLNKRKKNKTHHRSTHQSERESADQHRRYSSLTWVRQHPKQPPSLLTQHEASDITPVPTHINTVWDSIDAKWAAAMFQTGCLHHARPLFSTHMLIKRAYKLKAVSIKHNLFNPASILPFGGTFGGTQVRSHHRD